jgi:hypothetical protein
MANMDNIKKRYAQRIRHPVTERTYTNKAGGTYVVRDMGVEEITLGDMDKEYDAELESQGWDVQAMKRAGVNFDNVDPDDPALDRFKKGRSSFLNW